MNSKIVSVLVCLALFGGRADIAICGSYHIEQVTNGGVVKGKVILLGDAQSLAAFPITKDTDFCGKTKPSQRLSIGKRGGVRNAVVYLEGVTHGKKPKKENVVVEQVHCAYRPHISVVPPGSSLEIVNNDPILHNVHAFESADLRTLFNIAQPIKGQRTPLNVEKYKGVGIASLTCDAGHPWMNAFIVFADHPYYAVTDDNGEFVLKDVPPGTYQIRMWHEGVNVVRTETEGGVPKKYVFEDPYTATQKVVVPDGGTATVKFEFRPRRADAAAR